MSFHCYKWALNIVVDNPASLTPVAALVLEQVPEFLPHYV